MYLRMIAFDKYPLKIHILLHLQSLNQTSTNH